VEAIPTVLLVVSGKVQQRWVGVQPQETYADALGEAVRQAPAKPAP
jgi:hypothetical protein